MKLSIELSRKRTFQLWVGFGHREQEVFVFTLDVMYCEAGRQSVNLGSRYLRILAILKLKLRLLQQKFANIAYIVLVETLLQVSRSRKVQAQSMATNIFERMGSSWYLVSHHGSPLLRWFENFTVFNTRQLKQLFTIIKEQRSIKYSWV